ncbi:hypothetical protein BJX65DRAFT_262838 [Aspergillus insuetus]
MDSTLVYISCALGSTLRTLGISASEGHDVIPPIPSKTPVLTRRIRYASLRGYSRVGGIDELHTNVTNYDFPG